MLNPSMYIMDGPVGLDESDYPELPSAPVIKKRGFKEKLGDILASASSYPSDPAAVDAPPSRGQRIAGGIGNIMGGIGAAMAQPGSENGFENFFRGAGAAQGHANQQRDLGRQRSIEDFELQRQMELDRRAQDRLNSEDAHRRAQEKQAEENNRTREQNNADTNFLGATKEGRYVTIAPELSSYLEGKAPADFKTPDGFDRSHYEKIGNRWLQRVDKTPKELETERKNEGALAARGLKRDADGNIVRMTDDEISLLQGSQVNKNNATASATEAKTPENVIAQRTKDADAQGLKGNDRTAYILTGQLRQAPSFVIHTGGDAGTKRSDHSYEYHSNRLSKISDPLNQFSDRFSRLEETLKQGTPQADALVAPELLTVMAGGQGSGMRMNEAEISRIIGGRSKWENLKAAAQQWSLDPKSARSITPEQHVQIWQLLKAVKERVNQRQALVNNARQALLDSDDPKEHRRIMAGLEAGLSSIEQGTSGNPAATPLPRRAVPNGNPAATKLGGKPKTAKNSKGEVGYVMTNGKRTLVVPFSEAEKSAQNGWEYVK